MTRHFQSGQHPDADQISAFVDHALPAHEEQQMLAHLADCADCRETVALSLPVIESAPAAVKKSRPWLSGFRVLLPATAIALAVVLIYVHHATKSEERGGGTSPPEVAMEQPLPPANGAKNSPHAAGGGGGSTSLGDRVLEATGKAARAQATAPRKSQEVAEGNRLAAPEALAGPALHLPGGALSISAVTRGRQVLAIDDRNELFLSEDGGNSWIAVQIPWKSKAVKAELVSYQAPAAGGAFGAGFGAGRGASILDTPDAVKLKEQNSLRQELKGSYQVPASAGAQSAATPAPAATPRPTLTPPVPGATPGPEVSLTGVITDRSGAVIPAASVTVRNPANDAPRTAVAGADGRYRIDGLPTGTYQLEAEARGFNSTKIAAVKVDSSPLNTEDVTLNVGAATETVTVESSAQQIEPKSPRLGDQSVTRKQKSSSAVALVRPAPVFAITTDTGEHWISQDGTHWQHR